MRGAAQGFPVLSQRVTRLGGGGTGTYSREVNRSLCRGGTASGGSVCRAELANGSPTPLSASDAAHPLRPSQSDEPQQACRGLELAGAAQQAARAWWSLQLWGCRHPRPGPQKQAPGAPDPGPTSSLTRPRGCSKNQHPSSSQP